MNSLLTCTIYSMIGFSKFRVMHGIACTQKVGQGRKENWMQSMSAEFTVVDSTVHSAGQEDISLEITNWQIKWTPTTCLISKFNDDWA